MRLIEKKHPDQNHGKVFLFRKLSEWSADDKLERTVKIAETVREHMIIVLGRKDKVTGVDKIVTVRCSRCALDDNL